MENIQIHKKQSHDKSKILNFKELQFQFKSSMAQPNKAYNLDFENSKYFKQKPHHACKFYEKMKIGTWKSYQSFEETRLLIRET